MKIHPLCLLIPDLQPDEYDRLKADMAANGYDERFPVIVFNGAILDGRHRFKAAKELGIVPFAEEFTGTEADAARFVLRSINRRDLTAGQRAMIGVGLEPYFAEQAKERQKEHGKTAPGRSTNTLGKSAQSVPPPPKRAREEAAKAAGSSGRAVQDAKVVSAKAPDLAAKVKAGTLSLNAATKQIKQGPPPKKVKQSPADIALSPETAERFKVLANRVHALRRDIEALSGEPVGRELRMQDIARELKNVAGWIRAAVPHIACTAAREHADCKACAGTGWLTELVYANLPKELKG